MSRELILELFEDHHLQVFGYLVKMTANHSDAEDLLQQTFTRAFASAPNYRHGESGRAWIFRIARNLVIDRYRRQRKRLQADLSPPAAVPENQELRVILNQAIGRLPEPEREAFVLCTIGGLTYLEIANLSAESLATVRSRIYRARLVLRKALKSVGETRSKVPTSSKQQEVTRR